MWMCCFELLCRSKKDKSPPTNQRRSSKQEEPAPALPPRPGPSHPLFKYSVSDPHGICVHPYKASQEDDLAMEKEDVIVLLERIDDNWLFGRNVETEGMFPQRHIRIVKKLPSDVKMATGPSCVAMFDFVGESEDELTFSKGDLIELIAREGTDWLKGRLNNQEGAFPREYVEILDDLPEEEEAAAPADDEPVDDQEYDRPCCRATFDFEGQDSSELTFSKGDMIDIVDRIDADWLKGKLNGKEGIFPDAFVQVLKDIPPGGITEEPSADMSAGDAKPAAAAATEEPKKAEKEAEAKEGGRTDPYAVATFDYKAEASDELTFSAGDEIFLLRRIDKEWMEGVHVNKTGIFPVGYVEIKIDLPENEAAVKLSSNISAESDLSPRVEALFDFGAEQDDELTFNTGDIIYLLDREGKDWYMGELNNKIGKFPSNFVKVILDLP
ncbi:SH3 domain-containing protein 19-like [Sycon ciliatum]|uniref:SH3 domain-containing protein 19-like n=1 Tax=Sycon ciliatum TaxID=27933 RepID=UPI0031F70AEE